MPAHRFAIVRNGVVENVMLANSLSVFSKPAFAEMVAGATVVQVDGITVGPGYTYDGTTFSPPEPVE